VSKEASIAFTKTWVLIHYTDRRSILINALMKEEKVVEMLNHHDIDYALLCADSSQWQMYNSKILKRMANDTVYEKKWQNDKFILYELK
jgi:hypothetical protein